MNEQRGRTGHGYLQAQVQADGPLTLSLRIASGSTLASGTLSEAASAALRFI